MNWLLIDEFIKSALKEDIPYGDVTTNSIVNEKDKSIVDLIAKEEGIIAGINVFERVFHFVGEVDVDFLVQDGDKVKKGEVIGHIKGSTRAILTGERTALNYLQRMSGIATLTKKFVDELQGTNAKLLDTRKTTPNMRVFEKYAVKIGGGVNHRYNLSDGVLIKDNHIDAAGGIKNAIELVRKNASFVRKIEVEVENFQQLQEALEAKADIIMLDNMTAENMKKAVSIINGRAITEASGNITLDNIKEKAESGVDYISTGATTHSHKALDLSMKNLKRL
ncbi:putative nicotinate-nucleotide pyrophosphorylase [Clostridium acetireducens DSM 10703]|jgi:nicotinate-nucleotide pyrophosphorylase (carboxylating)|uniref:Probable nicotinate-nucleotide pyrophosphorylase [carboxylating] n=1 Tax=Clostridium acetireducens DSM 10703 TaxID=1121290 RepID=A0A1E8EV04_9CLOT|nr:carboxylating nicotinate-nucleotide diphosphorylase [Clostridium acetireducens]OFH98060.1 putative nicotinate-nucleotide pyrophosphorylase [Clostridium acetireducens DSM 10703]